MRFILGIDTASRHGSIALSEEGTARAWEHLAPGEHSSGLTEAAGRLLQARGIGLRDLAGIAVSGGPGSFTGLRIGLSWAKGVCFGLSLKLALISAHEANAHRHRRAAERIATVLSGERGEVQAALWSGGQRATRLWGPERLPKEELEDALRHAAGTGRGPIFVAGPDLRPEIRELLDEDGFTLLDDGGAPSSSAAAAQPDSPPPTAAAVAELGDRELQEGRAVDLTAAAPAYGRTPNARKPSA